jgi:hypothetical protein
MRIMEQRYLASFAVFAPGTPPLRPACQQ